VDDGFPLVPLYYPDFIAYLFHCRYPPGKTLPAQYPISSSAILIQLRTMFGGMVGFQILLPGSACSGGKAAHNEARVWTFKLSITNSSFLR
jgi:hypothetical protein